MIWRAARPGKTRSDRQLLWRLALVWKKVEETLKAIEYAGIATMQIIFHSAE